MYAQKKVYMHMINNDPFMHVDKKESFWIWDITTRNGLMIN